MSFIKVHRRGHQHRADRLALALANPHIVPTEAVLPNSGTACELELDIGIESSINRCSPSIFCKPYTFRVDYFRLNLTGPTTRGPCEAHTYAYCCVVVVAVAYNL